jgi:hypothetical protein
MSDKDIALTVGGILATMILAYMLWKRQQDSAAAPAPAVDASVDATDQAATMAYYSQQAQASYSLPQISVPSIGAASVDTSSTAAPVDSSSSAAPVDVSAEDLIAQIVAAYSPTNIPPAALPPAMAVIPPSQDPSIAAVPTTAADAIQQSTAALAPDSVVSTAIGMPGVLDYSAFNPQQSSPLTTSHPVTAHPITTTGQ